MSTNGGKSVSVVDDIHEASSSGGYLLEVNNNIKEVSTTGGKITTVKDFISETSTNGGKMVDVNGVISHNSRNGQYIVRSSGAISFKTGNTYDLICSSNIAITSYNGYITRRCKGNINDESTDGDYNLNTGKDINHIAGVNYMAKATGDINLVANGDKVNIKAKNCVYLNTPRLKVRNSRSIYGTTEPSELGLTDVEEGTIYFRLLD